MRKKTQFLLNLVLTLVFLVLIVFRQAYSAVKLKDFSSSM